jgi:hypothetical protein
MCKFVNYRGSCWRWSGRSHFGGIGVNSPIGSEPCLKINLIGLEICFFRQLEAVDEVAPTQRANLAVRYIEDALQLAYGIRSDLGSTGEGCSTVTDQKCHVTFNNWLEAVIIVDAAVRQQNAFSERGRVNDAPRSCGLARPVGETPCRESKCQRREEGRERTSAAA